MMLTSMIPIWSNFNISEIVKMIDNLPVHDVAVVQDGAKAKAPDWTISGALDT